MIAAFAAATSLAWVPPAAAASSSTQVCVRTISAKFAKFVAARMRVLQECHEQVLAGRRAGPCPDYVTDLQIDKLELRFATAIARRCGGEDRTCGYGGDDEALADLGWGDGACPGFEGGCNGGVSDCGELASCLTCIGNAAIDQAMTLAYGSLTPSTEHLNRCQQTIGRSLGRYFVAKHGALAACEDKVFKGAVAGPCPDYLKAARRIERAAAKVPERICRACGGFDEVCGAPDEYTAAQIGFPNQCPAVTVPGGPSCGGPNDSLQAIADCVGCVTDFKVDCLDAVGVRSLKPYPSQCD